MTPCGAQHVAVYCSFGAPINNTCWTKSFLQSTKPINQTIFGRIILMASATFQGPPEHRPATRQGNILGGTSSHILPALTAHISGHHRLQQLCSEPRALTSASSGPIRHPTPSVGQDFFVAEVAGYFETMFVGGPMEKETIDVVVNHEQDTVAVGHPEIEVLACPCQVTPSSLWQWSEGWRQLCN